LGKIPTLPAGRHKSGYPRGEKKKKDLPSQKKQQTEDVKKKERISAGGTPVVREREGKKAKGRFGSKPRWDIKKNAFKKAHSLKKSGSLTFQTESRPPKVKETMGPQTLTGKASARVNDRKSRQPAGWWNLNVEQKVRVKKQKVTTKLEKRRNPLEKKIPNSKK